MFQLKKIVPMFLTIFLIFTSVVSATESSITYSKEYNDFHRIHSVIVENGWGYLNEKNLLQITATADDLTITKEEYSKYLADIQSINNVVEEGGAIFDQNFNFYVRSLEEYKEFKDNTTSDNLDNLLILRSDNTIVPFSDPGAPPFKNMYSIAGINKTTVHNYFADMLNTLILSGMPNAGAIAYSNTVGFFVDKVKPGGAWDYKIVSGWGPWYNQLDLNFHSSREIQIAAYAGNYNYGFVGRELFTLSELLAAGDGISLITQQKLDGEDDKIPIRRGYSESAYY
ncbi:hypothetical protein EJP82_06445 [Paenibacillus anaericanus]|uniref:Uncharacterized protein n=1 Tax=Paenibacillus anaericanus TaxID=170367 RepID=A0A3S1DRB0_9BACL|nr:polymorphic toxin type 44 domain-containing protein [Paenibacillus anaericanus]RUT47348.1 hypothetical protein EJP82_06445 [Paenibacillus anaericanus]